MLKTEVDPEKKKIKTKSGDLTADKGGDAPATDFSNGPKEFTVLNTPANMNGEFRNAVDDKAIRQKLEGKNIYELKFKNVGGLVTPLIIEWTYTDGSKEIDRIPAEIWRNNEVEISKVFIKQKEVANIVVDPNFELADVEVNNNTFPKKPSKFDQFKKTN
jgi:hypothetical protein